MSTITTILNNARIIAGATANAASAAGRHLAPRLIDGAMSVAAVAKSCGNATVLAYKDSVDIQKANTTVAVHELVRKIGTLQGVAAALISKKLTKAQKNAVEAAITTLDIAWEQVTNKNYVGAEATYGVALNLLDSI